MRTAMLYAAILGPACTPRIDAGSAPNGRDVGAGFVAPDSGASGAARSAAIECAGPTRPDRGLWG